MFKKDKRTNKYTTIENNKYFAVSLNYVFSYKIYYVDLNDEKDKKSVNEITRRRETLAH